MLISWKLEKIEQREVSNFNCKYNYLSQESILSLGIQGGQAILSLVDSRIGFLGWVGRGLNLGATKFQVHHPCNVALV